jgi:hypothetical protein
MRGSLFLSCTMALGVSGCYLLSAPEKAYVSNEEHLARMGEAIGYGLDPELYKLVAAEIREDSLTLQFRGVRYVGDSAWVVRFSAKSSEQDPYALADVYSLLPLLAESRSNFGVTEEGKQPYKGTEVQYVRYKFDSPVRDDDSKALPASGILATLVRSQGDDTLVYHIKLDNHGDRDQVEWEDLLPLLKPILGA